MLASRLSRLILGLALAATASVFTACGAAAPTTECAPGLFAFKGGCMTGAGQNYATCIQDRGQNLSTEERAKLDAAVDTGIRGGGSTAVELSRTVVESELPEVAAQVIKDCLELSKSFASPEERTGIDQQVDRLQEMLDESSKGTIALKPSHGKYNEEIRVTGTDWPPNIEVEVSAIAGRTVVRTKTDDDGSFRTKISLDPEFESVMPSSIEIHVRPVKASTQLPASAIYQVED